MAEKGRPKRSTNSKKGKPTTTKVLSDNDLDVKKKADELLKDIKIPTVSGKNDNKTDVGSDTTINPLDVVASESGNDWLEDELDRATIRNTELENELVKAKEDYAKLFDTQNNAGGDVVEEHKRMIEGLKLLYNDLIKNSEKYKDANIKVMLGRLSRMFPFLTQR